MPRSFDSRLRRYDRAEFVQGVIILGRKLKSWARPPIRTLRGAQFLFVFSAARQESSQAILQASYCFPRSILLDHSFTEGCTSHANAHFLNTRSQRALPRYEVPTCYSCAATGTASANTIEHLDLSHPETIEMRPVVSYTVSALLQRWVSLSRLQLCEGTFGCCTEAFFPSRT